VILGEDAAGWLERHGLSALLVDHEGLSTPYGAWPNRTSTGDRSADRMGVPC
jgi:hypothetical protein